MLINSKRKKVNKLFTAGILAVLIGVPGAVYAAGTSVASIAPGSSSAQGSIVTATGTSGNLTVSSSGPAYYVQGYAKRSISLWPDTTAASAIANPGTTKSVNFSSVSGYKYYATAYTQANTTSIYGEARVKVN